MWSQNHKFYRKWGVWHTSLTPGVDLGNQNYRNDFINFTGHNQIFLYSEWKRKDKCCFKKQFAHSQHILNERGKIWNILQDEIRWRLPIPRINNLWYSLIKIFLE